MRKGSPYVLETAKRIGSGAVFRMVGPVMVSPAAMRELSGTVELVGPVPRSEIMPHYEWADVFMLPSVCEGSATVSYEALAAGLPVICTRNTGTVIRDGEDGFIVAQGDVDAVVDRLERFMSNPELLGEMSARAAATAQDYSIESYGRRLLDALGLKETQS